MPDSPASSNQIDSASDSFPAVKHHALRERGDQEIRRSRDASQWGNDGGMGRSVAMVCLLTRISHSSETITSQEGWGGPAVADVVLNSRRHDSQSMSGNHDQDGIFYGIDSSTVIANPV